MKKRKFLAVIIEIAIFAACFFMLYNYTGKQLEPKTVFVYKQDLEAGTELTPDLMDTIQMPSKGVSEDTITDSSDLAGMKTTADVFKGNIAYKAQVEPNENIDPLADVDWKTARLISIPTRSESLASIKKGDSVDLLYLGSGQAAAEDGGSEFNYSKFFLQDLKVYSTSYLDMSEVQRSEYDEEGPSSNDSGYITVVVNLNQAEEISARLNTGQIKFASRMPGSESYKTLGYVMGDYTKLYTGFGNAETSDSQLTEDAFTPRAGIEFSNSPNNANPSGGLVDGGPMDPESNDNMETSAPAPDGR